MFFVGIMQAAAGAGLVLYFKPAAAPSGAPGFPVSPSAPHASVAPAQTHT
jgi:hypothetical protein